jgi:hypothetical protein
MRSSKGVYVHHTAGPQNQTVREIQNFHMDVKGWSDIAYNWLVDDAGNIYEGRGWGIVGGATKGENSSSHSVCYIGNTQNVIPSDKAKEAINVLIILHNNEYGEGFVKGHKDSAQANTVCPGKHMYNWLGAGRPVFPENEDVSMFDREMRRGDSGADVRELQNMLNFWGHSAGVADGIFGAQTETALRSYQAQAGVPQTGVWDAATMEQYRQFIISIGGEDPNPPDSPTQPPMSEFQLAREWVIEQGISDGSNPTNAATREQVWVMLYRIHGDD